MSKPCGLPIRQAGIRKKKAGHPFLKIPEGDDLSLKFNSRRKKKAESQR